MVYTQSQGPICLAQAHDTFNQRMSRKKEIMDDEDPETCINQRLQYYAKQCCQAQQNSEDEGCISPTLGSCDAMDAEKGANLFESFSDEVAELTSPARKEVAANWQLWMEEDDEDHLPLVQRAFDPYRENCSSLADDDTYDHAAAMRDWRALWVDGTMEFEAEESTDDEEETEGQCDEFRFSEKPSTVNNYSWDLAKSDVEELDSLWEKAEEALPASQHAFDPYGQETDDIGFSIEEDDLPMFQHPFDPFSVDEGCDNSEPNWESPRNLDEDKDKEPCWPLKLGDLGGCDEPNELENEGCPPPDFPKMTLKEEKYDSDEEWTSEEQLPRIQIPKIQVFGENEGISPLGPFSPYEKEFQDDRAPTPEMWNYVDEEQEGEDGAECFSHQNCTRQQKNKEARESDQVEYADDYRSIPNLGSEQDDLLAPLLLKTYSNSHRTEDTTPSPPDTPLILKSLQGFFEVDDYDDCDLPAAQEAFDPYNHLNYGWAPLPDEDGAENLPSPAQVATAHNGKLVPPPPPAEAIAAARRRSKFKAEEIPASSMESPIQCIVQYGYSCGSIKTIGLNEGLDSTVGALKELLADTRGICASSLRASRAGVELQDWNAVEHLDFVHITQHHC